MSATECHPILQLYQVLYCSLVQYKINIGLWSLRNCDLSFENWFKHWGSAAGSWTTFSRAKQGSDFNLMNSSLTAAFLLALCVSVIFLCVFQVFMKGRTFVLLIFISSRLHCKKINKAIEFEGKEINYFLLKADY